MSKDSKPPSSRKFTPEEMPTLRHRTALDAMAHLYEIQAVVEGSIKSVQSAQFDSHLRMTILDSVGRIKEKVRQFEEYLGLYSGARGPSENDL